MLRDLKFATFCFKYIVQKGSTRVEITFSYICQNIYIKNTIFVKLTCINLKGA